MEKISFREYVQTSGKNRLRKQIKFQGFELKTFEEWEVFVKEKFGE